MHSIKEINEQVSPNVSIFNKTQMSNLPLKDGNNLFWNIVLLFQAKISSGTFTDASRQKLAHPFNDILHYCLFGNQICKASDFVWRWNPFYGNCYVFNSGYNSSGARVNYVKSLLPGLEFGLALVLYVGYTDKLNLFNAGFNSFFSQSYSYGLNISLI